MDLTDEQIANLKNAIASGVLSVRYGERTVVYQSLSDMRKVLADAEATKSGAPRVRVATVNKRL